MTERSSLEAIFFAALEHATLGERAAFLDEACAQDEKVRCRVERLLAAHRRVGNFLQRPVAEAANVAGFASGHTLGNHDTPSDNAALTQRPEVVALLALLSPSQRADSLGRLGHHEVLEVIGKGGMGIVLRAFDEKLHRVVAIKILAPSLATSAAARQRLVREARAAAAVTHDNVIAIHAVEDAGPIPYLVMQLISGPTLQEKLDRVGILPIKDVQRIGGQVAAGLAAAHAQGLVHRDVKPANILLENGVERVKITDFGLARAADDASLTQSGVIAGTPAYMSPEQANGEQVDGRSDLFSLGSVLYTLCTGHAPFRGSTTMAVLKRVCEDTARPLREVNPEIPEWLSSIIARLHEKDPGNRYQTAAEVAELLGRAHLQPQVPVRQASPVADRQAPRWQWRPRIALLVLLLLGTVVAGVVAFRFLPRNDETISPAGVHNSVQEVPPWKPRPPLTSEELAKLATPLDALKRAEMDVPKYSPPEVVASLGEPTHFRVYTGYSRGWMSQSYDGRLLAVPEFTRILLFDTTTGALVNRLEGANNTAHTSTFSPDGKWLAATCASSLFVWNVATGTMTGSAGPQPFLAVAFDREAKKLISGDAGGTIWVGVLATRIKQIAAHSKGVTQIVFSPDYSRFATSSLDGTCKIWDCTANNPDDWKVLRTLRGSGYGFEALAWSSNGKLLAAGDDTEVTVWNAETYEVLYTLKTPGKGLLAFSADGNTLVTARHDYPTGEAHEFSRWDMKTGKRQKTFTLFTGDRPAFFRLSPDGRTLFIAENVSPHNRIQAIDAETGLPRFAPSGHTGPVQCVAFSPDGRTLASGGVDRTVRLWDLTAWKPGQPQPPVRVLSGHTDAIGSVAFSPDGSLLATAGVTDGSLFLWDPASSNKVHDLSVHSHRRSGVAFTPDGSVLAAGGEGRVNLWDVRTEKRAEPLCWNEGPVGAVAFSYDGRLLASCDPRTIQLLDWHADKALHTFRSEHLLQNVTFSPDGKTLAAITQGYPPQLRLWDVTTGNPQQPRVAGSSAGQIFGMAFHPGGQSVATISWHGKVHLWDVAPSDKDPRAINLQGGHGYCVAFSPEGRYAAVGMENGTIEILRIAP